MKGVLTKTFCMKMFLVGFALCAVLPSAYCSSNMQVLTEKEMESVLGGCGPRFRCVDGCGPETDCPSGLGGCTVFIIEQPCPDGGSYRTKAGQFDRCQEDPNGPLASCTDMVWVCGAWYRCICVRPPSTLVVSCGKGGEFIDTWQGYRSYDCP